MSDYKKYYMIYRYNKNLGVVAFYNDNPSGARGQVRTSTSKLIDDNGSLVIFNKALIPYGAANIFLYSSGTIYDTFEQCLSVLNDILKRTEYQRRPDLANLGIIPVFSRSPHSGKDILLRRGNIEKYAVYKTQASAIEKLALIENDSSDIADYDSYNYH